MLREIQTDSKADIGQEANQDLVGDNLGQQRPRAEREHKQ